MKGPSKEVFFEQRHEPGQLCASDFTHMSGLEVRIAGSRFEHLVYHFVLSYSNWGSVRVCFSESFESLSEGLQHALWGLGGVRVEHRTDCLTTAVHRSGQADIFTQRYQALLAHYRLRGQKTQPGKAHKNGDVEQSHHRYKKAVDQALLLRGSRDFANREEYEVFLQRLVEQRNGGRQVRLGEETAHLRALPERRLEALKVVRVRVTRGSTIHVQHNLYSVPSRLIGEWVEVRGKQDALPTPISQCLGRRRFSDSNLTSLLSARPASRAACRMPAKCFQNDKRTGSEPQPRFAAHSDFCPSL